MQAAEAKKETQELDDSGMAEDWTGKYAQMKQVCVFVSMMLGISNLTSEKLLRQFRELMEETVLEDKQEGQSGPECAVCSEELTVENSS